jgi:hypothetical protein
MSNIRGTNLPPYHTFNQSRQMTVSLQRGHTHPDTHTHTHTLTHSHSHRHTHRHTHTHTQTDTHPHSHTHTHTDTPTHTHTHTDAHTHSQTHTLESVMNHFGNAARPLSLTTCRHVLLPGTSTLNIECSSLIELLPAYRRH